MTARACALLLALSGVAAPAQDIPTLRVQVRLVNLFVDVTDAHGAPVPSLLKANFAVTEDGVPQTVSVFERQTNVPLSVVLAIDTSGSTRRDTGLEQRAAHEFAEALLGPARPGAFSGPDQLALYSFNSDVREVVPFTNSTRRIDSGLSSLSRGPATALYTAVLLASQSLAGHNGRKVLVVVSDGSNTVEGTSYDEAQIAAQRGDVRIYSLIDVPIQADAGRDTGGEHAMITLAEQTGGRAIYVDQGGLPAALRKVVDDLRTQYLLAYYPQPGGKRSLGGANGFRAVRVTLQNVPSGAADTPHYREGYYRSASAP